jgi:hypothetical protein
MGTTYWCDEAVPVVAVNVIELAPVVTVEVAIKLSVADELPTGIAMLAPEPQEIP